MKRFLKWMGISLVLLLICVAILVYLLLRNSSAPYEGEIQISGVNKNIEITFDKMGIPQIWAENESDAMFALGWVHASERLFQMDITRRISQGRLSEVLGDVTLEMDIESRRIGHDRIVKKQITRLSSRNANLLKAYSEGVNSYVKESASLPFEFYLLGYDFEPWTVTDCLTILSFQTWFSDALQNPDKIIVDLATRLGPEKARSLIFDYPEWAPVTVPFNKENTVSTSFKSAMAHQLFIGGNIPFRLTESSNSWVSSPYKNESGAAILASDPHLETSRLPQFWYYAALHIREKDTNVLGITAAGLPFFVMGHNGKAAWAFTAGGVDITEYFEEQVDAADSTKYLTRTGWKNFEIINEEIAVSGKEESFKLDILISEHGPVFYENDSLKKMFTIDWAGFDTDINLAVSSGFEMMEINNFADFRKTVTGFGALDANWTYADIHGNIGFQLGTPVPVRADSVDNLPKKGWELDRGWNGYYTLDQTPHAYNPERGWLATANNKQAGPELGYSIQGNFSSDRILRLTRLLESRDKFSVDFFKAMQLDRVDESLLMWRDKLVTMLNDSDEAAEILEKLKNWDGNTDISSQETAFISVFLQNLQKNIFQDELGNTSVKIRGAWIFEIFDNKESEWYDNINTEDLEETWLDIVNKTFDETQKSVKNKTWGELQTFKMSHPFAVVPGLDFMLDLNFGPWPWPGTKGTPNASFPSYRDEKFNVILGPSWRFIIDFANPDEIQMVLPAGNSGNPMSPHFSDFIDLWKNGDYWKVSINKEKVYSEAQKILTLKKLK